MFYVLDLGWYLVSTKRFLRLKPRHKPKLWNISSDLLNEVIFSDLEKTLRSWILVLLEKLRLSGNHMLFGNTSSSFYLDKQVKKLTSSEADADLLLTNN